MLERHGVLERHEFFYSQKNAIRAYKKAQKIDCHGFRNLYGEVDGEWGTHDVEPRIKWIHVTRTQSDRSRDSFLNLEPGEAEELAEQNEVPVCIILELSEIERWIAEGKRGYGKNWSERTEAKLRKGLPSWLSRFIIKRM
jgi:hypothetical protein